jgi:signal peptide peptidase SppA
MLPRIAQRVFNTPLLIHPVKAQVIVNALASRLGVAQIEHLRGAALDDDGYVFDRAARDDAGYDLVGPVAIIPVQGTLVQRAGWLDAMSGLTGYGVIRSMLESALHDDRVQAIAFDIDSPGGEVAGCFDLVDAIYEARGIKPMWAILDEMAFSAAYAIASAADTITIPRTGGAGSIGVITMHTDMSRAIEAAGLTVTVITHGDRKAEGSELFPLEPEVRERIQADIDNLGDLFIATVARNRALPADAIREMQAGTFMGAQAVAAGLADFVAAPDIAVETLLDSLNTGV